MIKYFSKAGQLAPVIGRVPGTLVRRLHQESNPTLGNGELFRRVAPLLVKLLAPHLTTADAETGQLRRLSEKICRQSQGRFKSLAEVQVVAALLGRDAALDEVGVQLVEGGNDNGVRLFCHRVLL